MSVEGAEWGAFGLVARRQKPRCGRVNRRSQRDRWQGDVNSRARPGVVCLEGSSTVTPCPSRGPSASLLPEGMAGGNSKARGGSVGLHYGRFPVMGIVLPFPRD